MIEKEVAELRRRLRPEKNNNSRIRGCFVNAQNEIITQFDESVSLLPLEDGEKYVSLFRKGLTGAMGRNLHELSFQTRQVAEGEEHALLMRLRQSRLEDENALQMFWARAIKSLDLGGNYLLLLTTATYDVPYRGKDDVELEDSSGEQYTYLLCAVCPVKESKPALNYDSRESRFHIRSAGQTVSAPELGFLFPAFDDRATNLYGALYYTHSVGENYNDFVDAIFKTPVSMPAVAQRDTFRAVLGEALEEECSYEVVQGVQDRLTRIIEVHKESHVAEPLTVSKSGLRAVLSASGVSEEKVERFDERFDAEFGVNAEMNPVNLMDTKRLEIKMPDVVIQVNPERAGLVQTKMINGTKCIIIKIDDAVEVNGVSIQIAGDQLL